MTTKREWVSDTLFALTYEVYNADFSISLSHDEMIRGVIAHVENWVDEYVGDQPLTRDLIVRMVAEAMFAQFFYDNDNEPDTEWLPAIAEYRPVQESRAAVNEPPPESPAAG